MKLIIYFPFFLIFSCNMFNFLEPTGDHFDKCKNLADKGSYAKAIEECSKADPAGVIPDVQIEKADAMLSLIGFSLIDVSNVFLNTESNNADKNFNLILAMAEDLIDRKNIIKPFEKELGWSAIETFDKGGVPFYSVIARICYISLIMASSKSDGRGRVEGGSDIYKEDICNDSSCSLICLENEDNENCDGIVYEDANRVGIAILDIIALGSGDLGFNKGKDLPSDFSNKKVPDPNNPSLDPSTWITVEELISGSIGDMARKMLWDMAR